MPTIVLKDPRRWGSHIPLLSRYALITEGPIIEFGCGNWSTPVLHAMCAGMDRPLVSVEADPSWRAKLAAKYESPTHQFWADYDDPRIDELYWGVTLIDHARERRNADLHRMVKRSIVVVCHDTGPVQWYGWDWSDILYQYHDERQWAYTGVFSNTLDVHALEAQEPQPEDQAIAGASAR